MSASVSGFGFVLAAYLGAAALYGGYALALRRKERELKLQTKQEMEKGRDRG